MDAILIAGALVFHALTVHHAVRKGSHRMSEAIARLNAAVTTIGAGVARIASEVTETAAAIRDHVTLGYGAMAAACSGVAPSLSFAFTLALLEISSSTMSL